MARTGPQLRSQRLRMVNHQGDALRLGMNWTEEDLGKPQVLVDSAYGMGHPGTFHFRELIEEVSNGVYEAGGNRAPQPRHSSGILSLYARVAGDTSLGASLT
ncbi:hypothetical protein [Pseudonocardia adelaidensis]|uniref:Uncharacterized protein n=1 Tax=Pseudonocardia adelaidensis TaxID=648754 RepID=A0ABP9NDZ7_9PSEU